jgi:hypothetical protein
MKSKFTKFFDFIPLVLLMAISVGAKAQSSYCISQVGSPKPKEQPSPESDTPTTLGFRLQNASYQVVGIDDWLQYYRSNYIISQVQAPQFMNLDDYPRSIKRIKDLKLDRYNWLWIDGAKIDYIAPLAFPSGVLALGKPDVASKFVSRSCSYLENLFLGCPSAQGSYSSTLRQVFVTGYEVSLFGISSPQTYTIVAGKLTPLPQNAQGARLDYEVPAANGVILRGTNNEAIFFDGQRSTSLFPKNNWWGFKDTPDGKRAFLTQLMTSQGQGRERSFSLQELTPGPKLTPISVPSNFTSDLALFTIPKDPTLWSIFQDGLFAQVNGRFQRVLTFSKPMSFDYLKGVWQTPDGAIGFNLRDTKRFRTVEGGTNYFLRRRSPTANCQIPISIGGR